VIGREDEQVKSGALTVLSGQALGPGVSLAGLQSMLGRKEGGGKGRVLV
jgi:hypothetical protein